MIELIFVIVILGILAAVALPKFGGVNDQAHANKCKFFADTLNRTIGSSMWSESISIDAGGLISGISPDDFIDSDDIPTECLDGSDVFISASGVPNINLATVTFGSSTYDMNFTDGNLSTAPRWTWTRHP